jgi:hypothetical protein
MGCNGEKCIWSATRHSCRDWCRDHATKWADQIVRVAAAATDSKVPAMLLIDRLSIAGEKGMFVRGGGDVKRLLPRLVTDDPDEAAEKSDVDQMVLEYVSPHRIGGMSLCITACGLLGDPPVDAVSRWENQYTAMDMLEFNKWRGYPKRSISVSHLKGDEFLFRDSDGKFHSVNSAEASKQIAQLMSDKSLCGTRLLMSFDISVLGWSPADAARTCDALCVRDPSGHCVVKSVGGSGGRTCIYEPSSDSSTAMGSGVHISLDCGDFVAQWHTLGYLEAQFVMGGGRKNALFRAVMTW